LKLRVFFTRKSVRKRDSADGRRKTQILPKCLTIRIVRCVWQLR
jgi:hypothetical protein